MNPSRGTPALAEMYARPSQAELDARRANAPSVRMLTDVMHRDLPGPPTDDRLAQSQHLTEVIGLGIGSMASAMAGCTLRVMQRKAEPVFRSKKSRRIERQRLKVVRKSAGPQSGAEHHDDDLIEAKRSNWAVKLFDHVNETDTTADLLYSWIVQQMLTGTAPLWCRPSQLGYAAPPAEFYILPTALLFPLYYAMLPEGAYPFGAWRLMNYYPQYAGMAGPTAVGPILDGREIKRHRLPHPLFRWDGFSPLTQYGVTFDVVESIAQSWKSAMDNGFNPDVMVTVKGANEETLNATRAMMEQTAGGSRNARKMFLSDGEALSIEKLSTEPRQMDYSSSWDQLVKFALACLKIPPAMAGTAETTSYAQLYASLKQFHTLSLGPKARDVAQFLTKRVIYPYEKDLLVQITPPKIDDEDMDLKREDLLCKYGAVTVDELRGWAGKEPLGPDKGGDELIGKEPAPPPGAEGGDGEGDPAMAGDANSALDSILGDKGDSAGAPHRPGNAAGSGSLPGKIGKSRLAEVLDGLDDGTRWDRLPKPEPEESPEAEYEDYLEMARRALV